jgi:hypothetical protein
MCDPFARPPPEVGVFLGVAFPRGSTRFHDAAQPIGAENAEVDFGKAAQQGEVRVAPIDHVVVMLAIVPRTRSNTSRRG